MQSFSTLSLYTSLMCSATSCRNAFSMRSQDMQFPAYRKYKNGRNYFKILNESEFEELQVVGSKVILRRVKAVQFPEKIFIKDLLYDYKVMANEIAAAEFEELRRR